MDCIVPVVVGMLLELEVMMEEEEVEQVVVMDESGSK